MKHPNRPSSTLLLHSCLIASSACSSLPEPPPRQDAGAEDLVVSVAPAGDAAALPSVPRVVLRTTAEPPPYWIEGELSDYVRSKLRRGEVPPSVVERLVPVTVWEVPDGVVAAPARVLVPGAYTIISADGELEARVVVREGGPPLLRRMWPPPDGGRGSRAVFCASSDVPTVERLSLQPGDAGVSPVSGVLPDLPDSRCLSFDVPEAPSVTVPAPRYGEFAVDPAPLSRAVDGEPLRAVCRWGEHRFGSGCVTVEDDRFVLRAPERATFWVLRGAGLERSFTLAPGELLTIRGLDPEREHEFSGWVFDSAGHATELHALLRTEPLRAHVAIDEVLANPNGPEPASEWVELVNDGSAPVELGGWLLEDASGQSVLPPATLSPGARAVVVEERWVAAPELDVPPAAGTALIRVERIGGNGLSNSGEALRLIDTTGRIVSRFPAQPKPESGVSVARESPDTPDDALSGFGLHAAPGASPGRENELAPD